MLRFYKIPYKDTLSTWEISPITGNLMKSKLPDYSKQTYNCKIKESLHLINHPYEVEWNPEPSKSELDCTTAKKIERYNKKLFKLGNTNFFLSILYSYLSKHHFKTTHCAFSYISNLKDHEYGSNSCFQRCLLVAKTSKSFKKNGILYIGAELATFNMHAWIIEGNSQPDIADRVWINYRPMLAITY